MIPAPFKDAKFLFQLYVQLKMYKEGAKTALIIAQEHQQRGFYKTAHDLLFGLLVRGQLQFRATNICCL